MQLFTDRGTPYSFRHMNGYSGHTYVFYNKVSNDILAGKRFSHAAIQEGVQTYVKIHVKTDQGIKNFTNDEAVTMQSSNSDHHTQDLYDAIERGDYPLWTFYVQSMDVKQAETYHWNVFDMTKVWPHADFPLREFGRLTLNRNPSNYFNDVEQAAFSPSLLVPGIAASADPGISSASVPI
jgi:catalase